MYFLSSNRLESYIKDSVAGSDPYLKHPTGQMFMYVYFVLKNYKTRKQWENNYFHISLFLFWEPFKNTKFSILLHHCTE